MTEMHQSDKLQLQLPLSALYIWEGHVIRKPYVIHTVHGYNRVQIIPTNELLLVNMFLRYNIMLHTCFVP
jgi:hypothetical protein